jgi:hypothetical protein
MNLTPIQYKNISEGDGKYFITNDKRIFHKKIKGKILKTWKYHNVELVYLFDGIGNRKKYSISFLFKKYYGENSK